MIVVTVALFFSITVLVPVVGRKDIRKRNMSATLYLVPVTLGETEIDRVLPSYNRSVIAGISYFIVENVRTARRFLKKSNPDIEIDGLTFFTLNKHTSPEETAEFLRPLSEGHDVGVLSEAGCPAIADPGADVVAIAQQQGAHVVPLVGPSSILLALMASGFNGQSFAFHGYLPIDAAERTRKLKALEQRIYQEHQTQLFIETPYRNHKLLDDLIRTCRPATKLCVASNVTCDDEWIRTYTIQQWRKVDFDLSKRPTLFLLYK